MMRILVTGGAGFVGSWLCRLLNQGYPDCKVTAFDNLKRRGSELNLPVLKRAGVQFVHGDIRNRGDFEDLQGNFDLIVEASAEPSVHAGTGASSPRYLLDTNLMGTLNCLEFGRLRSGGVIFLSTSRVYSIPALRSIRLRENASRLEPESDGQPNGFTCAGVSEEFPTVGRGFRSFYGSTKLASELFIEEYAVNYNFPAIINRCGVIAGAGQFGKTDQGVFTLWVARHVFGGALSYTGFGGLGKQVRDILHPLDLFELMKRQLPRLGDFRGNVFGVGGGLEGSVSLREYTALCRDVTGREIGLGSIAETADVDIPYFVTDYSKVRGTFGWEPGMRPAQIVEDIFFWLDADSDRLRPLFT
jgi:CDP-paratose 2-epimerase